MAVIILQYISIKSIFHIPSVYTTLYVNDLSVKLGDAREATLSRPLTFIVLAYNLFHFSNINLVTSKNLSFSIENILSLVKVKIITLHLPRKEGLGTVSRGCREAD